MHVYMRFLFLHTYVYTYVYVYVCARVCAYVSRSSQVFSQELIKLEAIAYEIYFDFSPYKNIINIYIYICIYIQNLILDAIRTKYLLSLWI